MPDHNPDFTQPQLPFDEVHPDFITLAFNAKDITSQRFGRLVALGPIGRANNRQILWLCRCDCGNMSTVCGNELRSKHTVSCGCFNTENRPFHNRTHGMSKDVLYHKWTHIIVRCTSPTCEDYPDYGGRGISICSEWRHDFKAFHDYILQLPYSDEKGRTLDRIDNDGNYEPGNVRWATGVEQARNKRINHWITCNGETKCVTEWAQITGLNRHTIVKRLKHGLSVEQALAKK